ncbi:restriction endonuclease subunit S [Helicobacter equorum]|uniref:restriction endonuclease subunit S n=1 Tax=Helicobacter equorum TaxID=361872 RepID=UPI00131514C6|nr:restriction endonuclease subunit S [Helicobacter equorum]
MKKIPQGWEVKTIEDVCKNSNSNLALKDIKDKSGDYPVFGASGIVGYVDFFHKAQECLGIIKDGAGVGRVFVLPKQSSVIGTLSYLENNETTNLKYLFYFLKNLDFSKYILGSAIPHIYFRDYKKEQIPLPPLKEQGRIVGILDLAFEKIDKSVELLKANLANLDEFAQSALDKAFNPLKYTTLHSEALAEESKINQSHEVQTDKSVVGVGGEVERGEGATSQFKPLHPLAKDIESKNDNCDSTPLSQDDNSPYPLPQHWEWKSLGEICSVTDGTHKTPTYVETGIPFLSVKNISKGFFDLNDVRYISQEEHNKLIKRAKPEFGDILICRIGTLGKAIKISLRFEFSIFVSLGLLKPKIKLVSDYLAHFLNSYCIEKWINDNKVGGGTHTAKLNLNVLEKCPVALPKDIKEQEQIAMHLDSVFDKIQKLKELYNAQLQDYEELKQSLLTQAFSGKL